MTCIYLQVESSCGPCALHDCFVPNTAFPPNLRVLLTQLKLPILDLPATASSSGSSWPWDFLQQFGVSTQLDWQTLLKVLQQLSAGSGALMSSCSSSGADSVSRSLAGSGPVVAMQRLYEQVDALAVQSSETADAVRACFEEQPLLFVCVRGADGGLQGYWVTCRDVMWSGSKRIFPGRTFIKPLYKVKPVTSQTQSRLNLQQTPFLECHSY